jgi:hypothetical protein
MDLIPGLFCAAHFTVRAKALAQEDAHPVFLLKAGQALQRFWLTATQLGLVMQPSLAPLCFAHYGREAVAFTENKRIQARAIALAALVDCESAEPAIFAGRLGVPASRRINFRSLRRDLGELLTEGSVSKSY